MNAIEQLEHAIKQFDALLNAVDIANAEDILKASNTLYRGCGDIRRSLQLSMEIAKGEAHVMRWDTSKDDVAVDVHQSVLTHTGLYSWDVNEYGHDGELGGHYATFNGIPVIPTPNKIQEHIDVESVVLPDHLNDDNGWFDIASAPMDGTPVLITNGVEIESCFIDYDGEWFGTYYDGYGFNYHNEPATHWRPLPKLQGS